MKLEKKELNELTGTEKIIDWSNLNNFKYEAEFLEEEDELTEEETEKRKEAANKQFDNYLKKFYSREYHKVVENGDK